MCKKYTSIILFIWMLITGVGVQAQVVTVTNPTFTTPALAATYTSLANAITALNSITAISGAVTITLNPGNPQLAPVGGYVINFTAATTAARTVTITGNNNIITTNSVLVGGVLTDAIFKIIGSDFVTIQNFNMQENILNITTAAASNDMTEWGVALLYASTTNGAQNNTIRNNTIRLNRSYSNTFGIYSNTRHSSFNVLVTADATSTNGANSSNKIYGNTINEVNMGIAIIGSGNAAAMDLGNDIGGTSAVTGNTVLGWGGITAATAFAGNPPVGFGCYGIISNNQKNENISFNNILSGTLSGTPVDIRGIYKSFNTVPTGTFTSSITNNTITIDHVYASGILQGIRSEGISSSVAGATINITNNRLEDISVSGTGTTTEIIGISNSSFSGTLNINDNIFRDNFSSAPTAGFTAIDNSGGANVAININNNKIGDATGNAILFFTGSQPTLVRGINNNTAPGTGATLSISGNNFQGFIQNTAAASGYVFIECLRQGNVAPSVTGINSNTFTNLSINSSGNVTFIRRTGPMSLNAGITDNCNDNSIVTAFAKPVAGGTVTLYDCVSASDGGINNVMNQLRNNFSNITLTGATIMSGWNNVSGTANGPTKNINDNVFSNWTCGTGAVRVIQSDLGGNNSMVNDNIISGISAAATLTAITLGSGNSGLIQTCSGNTISNLSSTGGTLLGISGGSASVTTFNINNNSISGLSTSTAVTTISGIRMLTASTANVAKNKIFNLSTNQATSTVNGMDVAAAALGTYNISNNIIGDLRADITNSTIAIRGINLLSANAGTAYNVYYNTVYINALAGGTNFGTSALTATASATAANGTLSLRNNILVNTSVANGTGLAIAYRRTSTALNNFAVSSNNNIFYAGTPGVNRIIFSDGTNADQTLAAYQTRVSARDAASFTEMPPFLSTVGTSPDFLHLDPGTATQAENGAVNIAGYTDDFDGTIRQGNAGYGGSGTAPDIGADEVNGFVVVVTNFNLTTPALSPTYTSLASAITALNAVTSMVNGTVTITLMPGNSQTAPVGGYAITTPVTISALRNVIITGSNNTITASNNLVAGSLNDAIFKIIGSNFVTISNFVLRENPLNVTTDTTTNDMTEWGVALLKASATNGAQNNVIQNNSISLNRAYRNSFGIYSNVRHTSTNVSVIADATSAGGANSANDFYGNTISNVNMGIALIGSGNAAAMDLSNDVGGSVAATGNTISDWGGITPASSFVSNADGCFGIYLNHQKSENIAFNTITSASLAATVVPVRGIHKAYTATAATGTFTSFITNNTISISSGSFLNGICSEGLVFGSNNATININNNTLLNLSTFGTDIIGITNSSEPIALNINNNIFRGNTSGATTSGFTGIRNTGTIFSTLNINNNKLGDASGNAITFSGATSGAINGISCPVTGDDLLLSISGNNFQGFVQNVTGTGNHNYISYVHAPNFTTTVNINSNTFTNLTANTQGNVTFISRSGVMALNAGVTENCSNNSIVTAFNKPDGNGTITLYQAESVSLPGNTMVQTGNNFSNINFPNVNTVVGWNNSEGDAITGNGPTKTINLNTFSNWTLGNGKAIVMQLIGGGAASSVSFNTISTISSNASFDEVLGIYLGNSVQPGVINCSGNTISNISSSNGANVTGIQTESFLNDRNISSNTIFGLNTVGFSAATKAISVKQGSVVNIFRNKIYGLNGTGKIIGIDMPPGLFGTYTIHHNLIGSFAGENVVNDNAVRGINIESVEAANNFDVYYNTIHLNTNFLAFGAGSSGIFLTGNANGTVSLRNNIIVNISTIASGPGLTVALRRSSIDLSNYATSSNNNIFYAGTPSAANLIFFDGSNSDQLLSAFKTRVGPTRDAGSFTGLPAFLSTVGASGNFLHLDPAVASLAESRAVNIATYTTDFDANIRQGNAGYVGTGIAPDIGADEIAGIFHETTAPVITYTDLPSNTCVSSPKTITGVTITDATGIPLSGALRPRIYYRKNAGAWFSQPGTNTAGTATNSTWSFTIVETDMGGVALGDVVSYFIVAQDLMPVANVGTTPVTGTEAASVNTILIPPTTPKTYTITASLGGLYTVGSGGNFTTLTAAVNAYNNACSLTSAVIFELIPAGVTPETYPIIIRNHADASAVNTLTIRPSATTSIGYSSINDTELFKLDGARYVTFDGRQGGTGTPKSLNFINTGNLGAAFRFINDAQHNTIKFCDIRSQSKSTTGGTIVFSTAAAGGTGNDHNTIDNNQIKDPSVGQEPINAIFSLGTASAGNDSIVITNNNIFNYYNATNSTAGIFAGSNNNAWTITGNRLFQESPLGARLYTAAASHYGIRITSGAGYTISNNIIGFENQGGTGYSKMIGNSVLLTGFPTSYSITGSAVNLRYVAISGNYDPGGAVSIIDGNTIGAFALYTNNGITTQEGMFCGISVLSGNAHIGTVTGNTIGSTTGNNFIYVTTNNVSGSGSVVGIYANSEGDVEIQKNIIGSITASGTTDTKAAGVTGISAEGSANYSIRNNFIGNASAGNIRGGLTRIGINLSSLGSLDSTSGTAKFNGIVCKSTGNAVMITGNTLRGWSTSSAHAPIRGISIGSLLTGINPALTINGNFMGTAATGWGSSTVFSDSVLRAVDVYLTNEKEVEVKYNDFRGIGFKSYDNIAIRIYGEAIAGNNTHIGSNTFTNLAIQGGALYLIYPDYFNNYTATLTIDSNKTVGTFAFTGNNFGMIWGGGGLRTLIKHNEFSNATITTGFEIDSYTSGIGGGQSVTDHIDSNRVFNIIHTGAYFYAMPINIGGGIIGDTSTVAGNFISNISSAGYICAGIEIINYNNTGIEGRVIKNTITSFSHTESANPIDSSAIYGIGTSLGAFEGKIRIEDNEISALTSSIDSSIAAGIFVGSYVFTNNYAITINANKMYNLSISKPGARVAGIWSYLFEPLPSGIFDRRRISMYNNIIGDLRAPTAGSLSRSSIAGILMENNTVKDTIDIYHNTIDLRASSSHTTFSSAALYTDTLARINSYGNIFNNISTPGATGKTVAYWRRGANLANFSGDYNSLYAGSPSTNQLIYFDGTNSDQTLAAYKTRVGATRESSSVTELPVYASLTGTNAGFLHLDPNANCGLLGKAINFYEIDEVHVDFDNDIRPNWFFLFTPVDIGADETAKFNTWTGANSTSWNNPLNWSLGTVPNGTDRKVTIPAAPSNQPVIAAGENFQVRDITINTGASLTNLGTLKVAGNISAPVGGINNTNAGVVVGSIEMNGLCSKAQTLNGNRFTGNNIYNLKITTEVTIPATAGQGINLWGELNFGFMLDTLTTNGNLTIKSSASGTGSIGKILAGNLVKGDVTVERYINTGTSGGAHGKTWQFLAAPTTGQTIRQAWQENGTAPAGFGTIITGTGTGFDFTTALPSLKFYNDITNNWTAVTNTNRPFRDSLGYMIFVRGDRSVTTSAAAATPTVLRSKGAIYQDSNQPPLVPLFPDKFQSVGNPYASRIEFSKVRTQTSVGMLDVFYVWDPTLAGSYGYGGYQTITGIAGYVPTVGAPPTGSPASVLYPAGVAAPFIESGQAFFVKCRPLIGGVVAFNELNKATGNRLVTRPGGTSDLPENRGFITASLFTQQGKISDGNIVAFENGLSNELNENDADKLLNPGENFGILRAEKLLAVEARDAVRSADTIFYHLQNLKKQPYQFRFAPVNMRNNGLYAYLIDRFNNNSKEVSMTDSSFISFSITEDIRSQAADRFILVFKKQKQGPVKPKTPKEAQELARGNETPGDETVQANPSITVYPNPVVGRQFNIRFSNMTTGNYRIQLTNSQGQEVYTTNLYIEQGSFTRTIKVSRMLAPGNYLLCIIGDDGKRKVETLVLQ